MNLQQIIDLDRAIISISARMGPLLDADYREALERASSLLSEVRHFAVCWDDSKSPDMPEGYQLKLRQASIDRLVQVVRPD